MKRVLRLLSATALCCSLAFSSIFAETLGQEVASQNTTPPLNAEQSNPNVMGWMQGFPPPMDKILSARDGSFFNFPGLRYSVNHMQEFSTTRTVLASKDRHYSVRSRLDPQIDNIVFLPWGSETPMTWEESLAANYTDGIIIMHKGRIIYERYPAGLDSDGVHAAMSVTKSFTGTVASILIAQDLIDPTLPITHYIPELKGSGFDGSTVQNVLDMTTPLDYSEDYTNPNAGIWQFSQAGNVFRPDNYSGPFDYYQYLPTIKALPDQMPGAEFGYRTPNAEVIGWLVSRVTNQDLSDLVSKLIWQPLGAVYDGYFVTDPSGTSYAGGGFNLNLRDMAMFGEMLRNEGKLRGRQIIPAEAVKLLSSGGSPKVFAAGGEYPLLKGWSYKNLWWITNNSHGAYMARGVHGQAIYIDPAAEMVIARFASSYLSSNKYIDPTSIPAYEAVAEYLMKK